MAELVKIASATVKRLRGAPGDAVVVTGKATGGQAVEAEVYAPAGLLSRPPKDARGVFLPLGGSRRYGVVIAGHNYKVTISLADGETAIFSTTADGATLKAQIVLKADGTVVVNGGSKGAARTDDAVASAAADDPTFWTWLTAAAVVLAGLGVVVPTPTSLTSKITGGSTTAKVG